MSARRRTTDRGPALFPETGDDTTFAPRIVAGVDEAGLGPMLGPLAIGMAAFRVADARTCLWKSLAAACAREFKRTEERLVVADSKVVFTRTEDSAHRLERTVLAFASQLTGGAPHADTAAFLHASAPDDTTRAELAVEPWWSSMPRRLARDADDAALAASVQHLADELQKAGVVTAGLWVRAVPATVLNRGFERTVNKSIVHWEACVPFFRELWTRFGTEGIDLVVDRHGGRMRYATLLRATFPGASVALLVEAPVRSVYMVADHEGRTLRVTFAEKSEEFSFSVALASCAAKYAREACMAAFNAYFRALEPTLVPTAGYFGDARRWLTDAVVAIERSGLSRDAIVRSR